jgi:hypothetical protein
MKGERVNSDAGASGHGDKGRRSIPLPLLYHLSFIPHPPSRLTPPHPLDFPADAWIMKDVPSQSDPANDRRLISGVFRIRFPPRYRDGMQRVVRNLLNPTGSTITAKNTITFENDNVLALAA